MLARASLLSVVGEPGLQRLASEGAATVDARDHIPKGDTTCPPCFDPAAQVCVSLAVARTAIDIHADRFLGKLLQSSERAAK